MRVTITQPGTAVTGDPDYPDKVISYTSVRELNQLIQAASYPTTELNGAVRCPACLTSAGLFATVTLLYRRGRQPVACIVALCDAHGEAESARITSYGWPHLLTEGAAPVRCRAYDLSSEDGQAAVRVHLACWPDALALFTAGMPVACTAGPVPVPEPAGAPS